MGKHGPKDDDEALWAHVVRTASPLKRREPRPPTDKAPKPAPKAKPALTPQQPPRQPAVAPSPKPGQVAKAAPLDRQTARQLVKGRLEVDAKLDLHGMRQRDAHAQLRRFLKTAQARGLKHVLIITGKGADPETSRSFYEEEERGVLRNAVPRWLAEPDFAPLVVSFSSAPRQLGGEGALYVRVRKLRDS
jgi:DNA-nicking Smr family endonuclease